MVGQFFTFEFRGSIEFSDTIYSFFIFCLMLPITWKRGGVGWGGGGEEAIYLQIRKAMLGKLFYDLKLSIFVVFASFIILKL